MDARCTRSPRSRLIPPTPNQGVVPRLRAAAIVRARPETMALIIDLAETTARARGDLPAKMFTLRKPRAAE